MVDPLGDSSVSVGTGRLRVSLPAGRAHDLWEGALHAPRVLQAAADADFEIEAKYDSPVGETYQSQGLVAQADFDDLVRFDVYSAGGETRLFAATFVGRGADGAPQRGDPGRRPDAPADAAERHPPGRSATRWRARAGRRRRASASRWR